MLKLSDKVINVKTRLIYDLFYGTMSKAIFG